MSALVPEISLGRFYRFLALLCDCGHGDPAVTEEVVVGSAPDRAKFASNVLPRMLPSPAADDPLVWDD
jgi:hypothetical protein